METTYDKILCAICVFREARGDGNDAMRAVAHVINNRAQAWKKTWAEVITDKNQFSSISVLGDSQTIVWLTAQGLAEVEELVEAVASGASIDNTHGALYYANEAHLQSEWYQRNIITPEHPVTALIGKQTFRK